MVYVVGIYQGPSQWALLGVFETEALARAACTQPLHFYGPVELNKRLCDDAPEDWATTYPRYNGEPFNA